MTKTGGSHVKIIGFGNAMRTDDGVGAAVVDALKERGVEALAFDGDGTELMEAWQDCELAILVDAMTSDAPTGTIRRFDVSDQTLPQETLSQDEWRSSSHTFGLVQAVEIARVLDRLPPRLIVFGVEGENFEYGRDVSPDVAGAVEAVAQRIQDELPS